LAIHEIKSVEEFNEYMETVLSHRKKPVAKNLLIMFCGYTLADFIKNIEDECKQSQWEYVACFLSIIAYFKPEPETAIIETVGLFFDILHSLDQDRDSFEKDEFMVSVNFRNMDKCLEDIASKYGFPY